MICILVVDDFTVIRFTSNKQVKRNSKNVCNASTEAIICTDQGDTNISLLQASLTICS